MSYSGAWKVNRAIAAAEVRNRLDSIQTGLAESQEELRTLRELCAAISGLLRPHGHEEEAHAHVAPALPDTVS
jgi:hypothetical protein